MLVLRVTVDARTGERTEEWVDDPDALTPEQGEAVGAELRRQEGNAKSLLDQADQAMANLRAYRDLASPTNAQTVAVVKLLCRVAIALIRLRLAKFDATD